MSAHPNRPPAARTRAASRAGWVQAAAGAPRQRGRSAAQSLDAAEHDVTLLAAREVDLDRLFKRLHLANARHVWRDLVRRAEAEQWSYHDFLAMLVAEEVAHRQQTRVQRLSRRATFPFLKTIDDFDFTYQTTVKLALLGSALSPDFVTDGRSLILHGKSGRGKTHLAVAVAYRAILNGFDALFVTAAELIDDLSAAFRAGRLADALLRYVTSDVLVIDEVGYLTYGTDAANMLYHVVNDRHRLRRSMVFTSNKHPDAWGAVLHDDDLAAAIVDRVLERGRLLHLDGPSLRTHHLGLDAPSGAATASTQVVRISGTPQSEFPEPTRAAAAAPARDVAVAGDELEDRIGSGANRDIVRASALVRQVERHGASRGRISGFVELEVGRDDRDRRLRRHVRHSQRHDNQTGRDETSAKA